MKPCGYCGRQADDQATHCSECGTPFAAETPPTAAELFHWTPQSEAGLGVASGLAAMLIATGVYIAFGKAYADLFTALRGGSPPGVPRCPGVSPSYSLYIMIPPVLIPFLVGGIIVLTFFLCTARCRKRWHGVLAAVVSVAVTLSFRFVPGLWWFVLPAVTLGFFTNSPLGVFAGAAIQIAVGVWLLGWFGRGNPDKEPQATKPNSPSERLPIRDNS
jgi:hypothetical protein